jgi:hypothetical protein
MNVTVFSIFIGWYFPDNFLERGKNSEFYYLGLKSIKVFNT